MRVDERMEKRRRRSAGDGFADKGIFLDGNIKIETTECKGFRYLVSYISMYVYLYR